MIGIYGGVFNPIHIGHLLLAEFIREELELDKIVFVPAGNPPHKQVQELESAQHRYNMVQIAIGKNPFFDLTKMEISRGGMSYTSDTLEELAQSFPGRKLYFICGADSIINLPSWHNINKIFEIASLIVAGRPKIQEADFQNMIRFFKDQYCARIIQSEAPLMEVSSTQIRDRLKNGQSIRYMVPDEVLDYIQLHRLY